MEAMGEILAFEIFHRDIGDAFPFAVIEDLHDMWATQLRCCLRLVVKASSHFPVVAPFAVDEFDGAERVEPRVLGQPNGSHPASP